MFYALHHKNDLVGLYHEQARVQVFLLKGPVSVYLLTNIVRFLMCLDEKTQNAQSMCSSKQQQSSVYCENVLCHFFLYSIFLLLGF